MFFPFNKFFLNCLLTGSVILLIPSILFSQKYYTKNGSISFFSKTPVENISARNNQVMSVLNKENGEYQFSLLIKNFHFKKALMEEHFNENYLESDRIPKAIFKGNVGDISLIDFSKDGTYKVTVTGDLTIHGITNKISSDGILNIKAGNITADAKFMVKPSDYNITIPKLVRENIAETIEVTVSCNYDQKM